MESILNEGWNLFVSSLDLVYIIICNIATYAVLKMVEGVSSKKINTAWKRITSAVVAAILGVIAVKMGHNAESVLYGFFIQFVLYDYFWKWAIKKLEKFSKTESNDNDISQE